MGPRANDHLIFFIAAMLQITNRAVSDLHINASGDDKC
jgi:hypothetical protein